MLMFGWDFEVSVVEIMKQKFDQDLCLNLWYYPLGYLGIKDELNPRVRCAFGNVLKLIWYLRLNNVFFEEKNNWLGTCGQDCSSTLTSYHCRCLQRKSEVIEIHYIRHHHHHCWHWSSKRWSPNISLQNVNQDILEIYLHRRDAMQKGGGETCCWWELKILRKSSKNVIIFEKY